MATKILNCFCCFLLFFKVSNCLPTNYTNQIETKGNNRVTRIVGGNNASEGQFKYTVSLQIFRGLHYCGGSIISTRTILTAAHCYKANFPIQIMIGSIYYQDKEAKRYSVEAFIPHENFDKHSLNYDIAVVILTEEIQFNDMVQPIPLTNQPAIIGESVVINGWGFTSEPPPPIGPPNQLQWLQLAVINEKECEEFYEDVDSNFCIFASLGHGVCRGDSGGPVVNLNGELVGVISEAYPCAIGYPDSCTDVFKLKDWIRRYIV